MNHAVTVITPWQLFLMGGPVMWPILGCSVAALTLVIRKLIFLSSLEKEETALRLRVMEMVRRDDIPEAVECCSASHSLSAPVFKAGLLCSGRARQEIMATMSAAARLEVPRIEEGLAALTAIVGVAPLLGLLGTVLGLCNTFHMIEIRTLAMNPVTPGDIAAGVWQALITTVAGLLVAIPASVAFNYLTVRAGRIVLDMEKAAMDIAELMVRGGTGPLPREE